MEKIQTLLTELGYNFEFDTIGGADIYLIETGNNPYHIKITVTADSYIRFARLEYRKRIVGSTAAVKIDSNSKLLEKETFAFLMDSADKGEFRFMDIHIDLELERERQPMYFEIVILATPYTLTDISFKRLVGTKWRARYSYYTDPELMEVTLITDEGNDYLRLNCEHYKILFVYQ